MSAAPPSLAFPFPDAPQAGEPREVAPGVLWLRMPLPFALDHINLWLLAEADGHTIVDCGYGSAPTRAAWERVFATTLTGSVRRVLATHCHPDHVGNAAWLTGRFGCPLAMTHAEFLTAHAMREEHSGYGVAPTVELFRQHGLAAVHVEELAARGNAYARGVPAMPTTFERLVDGDALTLGGTSWQVIEGHGHSPEHAALFCPERRLLISGDMLLPRISTNVSIWAAEPDGDPLRRFLDSLERFERMPPDTLVLPSHGLPFRGIAARVGELRQHHADRLEELEAAIAAHGPSSAAAIVPVLFRRELDLQQRFFAMGEAIAHLNHLWHAGRLRRARSEDNCILFARPR